MLFEVKPEDQIRALAKEFDGLVKRHDKEKGRIEKARLRQRGVQV